MKGGRWVTLLLLAASINTAKSGIQFTYELCLEFLKQGTQYSKPSYCKSYVSLSKNIVGNIFCKVSEH